jgi:hypothetical protein
VCGDAVGSKGVQVVCCDGTPDPEEGVESIECDELRSHDGKLNDMIDEVGC